VALGRVRIIDAGQAVESGLPEHAHGPPLCLVQAHSRLCERHSPMRASNGHSLCWGTRQIGPVPFSHLLKTASFVESDKPLPFVDREKSASCGSFKVQCGYSFSPILQKGNVHGCELAKVPHTAGIHGPMSFCMSSKIVASG